MVKVTGLVMAGVAMLVLNGCNFDNNSNGTGTGNGGTTASVYIEHLADGYMISGTDTSSDEDVDLCFEDNKAYKYGRGTVLFTGSFKTNVNRNAEIDFYDDDGGVYTLEVNGEVTEGYTYYFNGIQPHNIHVDTITRVTSCASLGMFVRTRTADVH